MANQRKKLYLTGGGPTPADIKLDKVDSLLAQIINEKTVSGFYSEFDSDDVKANVKPLKRRKPNEEQLYESDEDDVEIFEFVPRFQTESETVDIIPGQRTLVPEYQSVGCPPTVLQKQMNQKLLPNLEATTSSTLIIENATVDIIDIVPEQKTLVPENRSVRCPPTVLQKQMNQKLLPNLEATTSSTLIIENATVDIIDIVPEQKTLVPENRSVRCPPTVLQKQMNQKLLPNLEATTSSTLIIENATVDIIDIVPEQKTLVPENRSVRCPPTVLQKQMNQKLLPNLEATTISTVDTSVVETKKLKTPVSSRRRPVGGVRALTSSDVGDKYNALLNKRTVLVEKQLQHTIEIKNFAQEEHKQKIKNLKLEEENLRLAKEEQLLKIEILKTNLHMQLH